jgi:hypothetical protein
MSREQTDTALPIGNPPFGSGQHRSFQGAGNDRSQIGAVVLHFGDRIELFARLDLADHHQGRHRRANLRGQHPLCLNHRGGVGRGHRHAQFRAARVLADLLADPAGQAHQPYHEQRAEQEEDEAARKQDRGEITPSDHIGCGQP